MNSATRKLAFFFYFLGIFFGAFAQNNAVLVKNGQPYFTISVAPNASDVDHQAAVLLQSSINKIAGCELKILKTDQPSSKNTIYITSSASLGVSPSGLSVPKGFEKHLSPSFNKKKEGLINDGFVLSVQKDNILVVSGGNKGAYYGVVHLLEKYFACRMYAPNVELFPAKSTLNLPFFCEAENPASPIRIVNGLTTLQNEAYRNWQRLNDHNEEFAKGFFVHTFNRLVPWETYFKAHPEYFALVSGKRSIDQLCLTNPAVYDLTIRNLRDEMLKQPNKKLWSVSQGDNFSYCQCDKCAEIIQEEASPAGPIIHFVNKVAAQFPDKTISTLAYQYSRKAPQNIKPADNVQIMLCTIELNRSKGIEQDPRSQSFLKDMEDWGKISKNIFLWDYTVNFSHYISPFPNLHTLAPNIQFFVKNNVNAHFQQTNMDVGHEFSELKGYLIARLLWNPQADVDALTADFLNNYYGAAGTFIKKYLDKLTSEITKTGEWLDIYGHPVSHAKTFLSAENLKLYNQYFDAAEAAVKDDSAVLQRVKVCRLPIQYAMMEIGKSDMFGARGFYEENKEDFILKPEMKQTLEGFHAVCKQNGVKTINEAGLSPLEYYESTKRFIDVQVKGNLAFRKKIVASLSPSAQYSNADLMVLTNGVQGASDYKVHWLGWEAQDFELVLDLEATTQPQSIHISTLYDPKSWILHPKSVACYVSEDGVNYRFLETINIEGEQRQEKVTRNFEFTGNIGQARFIKFAVEGTKKLFDWHPSAGNGSWVFVDEVVVR